jgi:hypothetical protein
MPGNPVFPGAWPGAGRDDTIPRAVPGAAHGPENGVCGVPKMMQNRPKIPWLYCLVPASSTTFSIRWTRAMPLGVIVSIRRRRSRKGILDSISRWPTKV